MFSVALYRSKQWDIVGHSHPFQLDCSHQAQVPSPCGSKPPASKAQLKEDILLWFSAWIHAVGVKMKRRHGTSSFGRFSAKRLSWGTDDSFWEKMYKRKIIAWNSKWWMKVVRSVVKMSRPTLRPAGTLWAFVKMLKESAPFTWRQL